MDLLKMTIEDFIDLLGSDAPAPGGGSAAALYGCVGMALTGMVAALTIGRAKYKAEEPLMQTLLAKSETLKQKMMDGINRDTASFNGVSAVFKMPKVTEEEKALRSQAMQDALKEATTTPFALMCDVLEALALTERAVGHSNPNAASDLGVSAIGLKAAAQSAWLNVLINLSGIKDDAFVEQYKRDGAAILDRVNTLADSVYNDVMKAVL